MRSLALFLLAPSLAAAGSRRSPSGIGCARGACTWRPPPKGEERIRAEVLVGGRPRTVTSHLFVALAYPPEPGEPAIPPARLPRDCGCGSASGGLPWLALLLAAAIWPRLRESPRSRASRSGHRG